MYNNKYNKFYNGGKRYGLTPKTINLKTVIFLITFIVLLFLLIGERTENKALIRENNRLKFELSEKNFKSLFLGNQLKGEK